MAHVSSIAGLVVKFSSIAGGVFIEVPQGADEYAPTARCWRFDREGRAEWAPLASLETDGERARFYGHVYTSKNFVFC